MNAAITSTATEGLPKVGEILSGKYRIERMLAEGGMGLVVEARHIELDDRVAIKFLRPDVLAQSGDAKDELVERFLREAKTAIKIRSEHVVRVLDVGKLENQTPYMVMEFLEGLDLDQELQRNGALSVPEAVDHVLQACEAIAEAHSRGMVHRDLKPANLLLARRPDGSSSVKVLDFGISKIASDGSADFKATKANVVMGSPKYMSPEQLRSSRDVDPRADIWSIGTILYELLMTRAPFDGSTMTELCAAILQDDPPAMTRDDLPADLAAAIVRCLAKKPEDRFANVAELAYALTPFGTDATRDSANRAARVLGVGSGEHSSAQSYVRQSKVAFGTTTGGSGAKRTESAKSMTQTSWDQEQVIPKSRTRVVAIGVGALILGAGLAVFLVSRTTERATVIAPAGNAATSLANSSLSNTNEKPTASIATSSSLPSSSATALAASSAPTVIASAAPPIVKSPSHSSHATPPTSNTKKKAADWDSRK